MFYASAYRLLLRTGGEGLLGELRGFVPVGWTSGGNGVGWLERSVEGDVEIGGRGREAEGGEEGGGVVESRQRKKRPVNGFRSGASPPRHAASNGLKEMQNTEVNTKEDSMPNQISSSQTPTLTPTASSKLKHTSQITTPSKDSPAPTHPPSSKVYPTRRAILSRPLTKPYIHALCRQRFGHPQDVRRHHIGQGGRPGCWERNGKPDREWDEHESCKVTFGDLVVKKVEGGFVVLDWGNATDPDVDKDDRGGEDEQRGEDVQMEGEGGQEVKMEELGANELEEDARDANEEHDSKRRKVSNGGVPIGDADFRAVALGLRARK